MTIKSVHYNSMCALTTMESCSEVTAACLHVTRDRGTQAHVTQLGGHTYLHSHCKKLKLNLDYAMQ